ncbi:hypothetical protein EIP91_003672 [Steccherinum ochraceum]|uniref:RNA-dependent RNA polymerase n=1 Tax=Steccherinum ochraceum TaxID=92696 RepID=A0A4R0RA41_9APHY|nr:hypothetical protein EIP91_003672 [Steccherinum ochraceum]
MRTITIQGCPMRLSTDVELPGISEENEVSPATIDDSEDEDEYDRQFKPLPGLKFDIAPEVVTPPPLPPPAKIKKRRTKDRQLSDKGVGTDTSDYHHAVPFIQQQSNLCTPSDDERYWTADGEDGGDEGDSDVQEVEEMLAGGADKNPLRSISLSSFTLSGPSRSGTLTSIGTSSSDSSRSNSRKRIRLDNSPAASEGSKVKAIPSQLKRKQERDEAIRAIQRQTTAPSLPDIRAQDDLSAAMPPVALTVDSAHNISFICHNTEAVASMDACDLAFGTQYEIARGVSDGSWTWSDVTPAIIMSLRGSNSETAHRVDRILGKGKGRLISNSKVWEELDREQAAIKENKMRGLGLQGDWEGVRNWYGGRLQLVAHVQKNGNGYALKLGRIEMKKSHRFARFLGSRHIMQFKLPEKFDDGQDFMLRRFILLGRVFVPFCVKDGNVHLVEINQDFERQPLLSQGDQYRISFNGLILWYNPMDLNGNQPVNKWIARFDLGLSTSVPVLCFAPENIFYLDDEYAPHTGSSKVPTEKIYTDGCGFMNGAALMAVMRQLAGLGSDRDRRPTAVQGRILGSKGLWVLHPEDQSPDAPPRIWIRDSQIKVKLVAPGPNGERWTAGQLAELHPAHLIFDLVAPSRSSTGSRLSRSTIMNLSHNKVPTPVLVDLMRTSLLLEISPLLSWTGLHAERTAAGAARALGLTRWIQENGQEADDTDAESESLSATEDVMSLHEKILSALQAGFSPLDNLHLYEDFRAAITRTMTKFVKEYHITIPESADAFIVPDPYGVLNEGEIHFKSSRNLRDPLEFQYPDILTGDVLIYRNPCRLPSDVRKVEAVQHPQLAEYMDVIVLPVKGAQSLASILAGGDVDGDVAVCIYDDALVKHFSNSPICKEPPQFLATNFEPLSSVQTVSNLRDHIKRLPANDAQLVLQRRLLSSFTANFQIGKYSKCHENAAYAQGYDNPVTVRLAFMFNTVLDSRKTGLVVKDDIHKQDMRDFNRDPPDCMSDPNRPPSTGNSNALRRQVKGPKFILEQLLEEGARLQTERLSQYESLRPVMEVDNDLTAPYRRAKDLESQMCPEWAEELRTVEALVEECCVEGWTNVNWGPSTPGKFATEKQKKKRAESNRVFQAAVHKFSTQPSVDKVPRLSRTGILDEVKASYAYSHKPGFAIRAAFRQLCTIKARTKGLLPITNAVGQSMSVSSAAQRVYTAQTDSMDVD